MPYRARRRGKRFNGAEPSERPQRGRGNRGSRSPRALPLPRAAPPRKPERSAVPPTERPVDPSSSSSLVGALVLVVAATVALVAGISSAPDEVNAPARARIG